MKNNVKKMLSLLVEMEQDTLFCLDYYPWMTDVQINDLISRLQKDKSEGKKKEAKIKSLFFNLPKVCHS